MGLYYILVAFSNQFCISGKFFITFIVSGIIFRSGEFATF